MIRLDKDEITPRLAEFQPRLHSIVSSIMNYGADVSQANMKANAPWTDRTSNARNTLSATAFNQGDQYVIVLYHQMPYGIWLEVRWSGRYAIILPTVETVGPQVMRMLRSAFRRM